MTVNSFFVLLLLMLGGIFFFFKPIHVETEERSEVAQLDLYSFTVYELDQAGLRTVMSGSKGWRFSDRYEVDDVNYTDNTGKLSQNMVADFGRYRDDFIDLEGNVHYAREDGLAFLSNEATYNQKHSVAKTKGDFIILQNGDRITGKALHYGSADGRASAKKITAVYNIREGR